jgi:hypothetical protein
MSSPTRTHRNATELTAERARAEFERDTTSVDGHRREQLGVLDALDWLEGLEPCGPASGTERGPELAGRELSSAVDAEYEFLTEGPRENADWARGVIRGLKWYLLDPSA